MYNRANRKAEKKLSASAIHNQTMEALAQIKEMQKQMASDLFMFGQARSDGKPLVDNIKPDTPFQVVPVQIPEKPVLNRPKPFKTISQYFEAKRECTCEADYQAWLAEVDADPNLGTKQKQLLKTTNPSGL